MIGAAFGPSMNPVGYTQAPPRRQQQPTNVPPVYTPVPNAPTQAPQPTYVPQAQPAAAAPAYVPYVAPDVGGGAMFAPAQTSWLGYDHLPGKPAPRVEDDEDDDDDEDDGPSMLASLLGLAAVAGAAYGVYYVFWSKK